MNNIRPVISKISLQIQRRILSTKPNLQYQFSPQSKLPLHQKHEDSPKLIQPDYKKAAEALALKAAPIPESDLNCAIALNPNFSEDEMRVWIMSFKNK